MGRLHPRQQRLGRRLFRLPLGAGARHFGGAVLDPDLDGKDRLVVRALAVQLGVMG